MRQIDLLVHIVAQIKRSIGERNVVVKFRVNPKNFSLSLSISFFFSLSLSLSLSLCLSVSVCLSVCLCLCLSVSLSVSLSRGMGWGGERGGAMGGGGLVVKCSV